MALDSREYFERLESLFHEAVAIPPGPERQAFLTRRCGDDARLTADLERMLAGDTKVRLSAAQTRLPRFGVYLATALIGRGGMGAVYLATREDGEVNIRVAVKVVSSPLWSQLLEDRFRRERQILAQLRHPGIASFLDGGVSEDGLPFLVMEYVEGDRIDAYCERNRLSVPERLRLFLQVCAAVGFAHQQLVVHRDIKPGYVLVTVSGEPKLLDFGLARTLESAVSAQDSPTLYLTPVYSSPEALRGRPAAVTDDVYSLGVLLYELLVGERPSADTLDAAPPRPSAIARARGASGEGLRRALAGDLDAIAVRAVAPTAAARYASVAELAEDICACLEGRSVRAVAGGSLYRLRKFVWRHKAGVGASVLVVLSLAGGLTAALLEAREARRQRAAGEQRFQVAREMARYMMFELQAEILKLPGSTPVKADMVRHSLAYLDRLAAARNNDEGLQIDIAEGYSELADVLGHPLRSNLGEAAQAREAYRKALGILEPVVKRDARSLPARRAMARAQLMLGLSLTFYRQWDQGRKLVDAAAGEVDRLSAGWPGDFAVAQLAATAQEGVAVTVSQRDGYTTGGGEEAVRALEKSIRYAQAALRLKPGDADATAQLASSYNRLAVLTQTHDRPAAAKYFELALATLDSLPAGERETAGVRNRRASMLLASGWNLGSSGDFARGLTQILQARALIETLAAEDPRNRIYPQARASIYRNLGVIEDYAGHTVAALEAYRVAIETSDQLLLQNPQNPYFRTTRADLQASSALLSARLGRRTEAARLARAGVPVLRGTAMKADASASELNLAARFLVQKELPEVCDPALGLRFARRANAASGGKDYVLLETLAQAEWMNRNRDGAVRAIVDALALIEPASRVRTVLGKELAAFRSDPLPAPCGRPQKPGEE